MNEGEPAGLVRTARQPPSTLNPAQAPRVGGTVHTRACFSSASRGPDPAHSTVGTRGHGRLGRGSLMPGALGAAAVYQAGIACPFC